MQHLMTSVERWARVSIARENLIVWGASDQCRVNFHILVSLGCQIKALIDDTPRKRSPFMDIPIYEGESGLDAFLKKSQGKDLGFVIAIGNPYGDVRVKLHFFLKGKSLTPVSFADPTALICKTATYGEGFQVMPAALVLSDVKIGDQCIINTRALVEHDCVLGDGVEIGPGAVLCGRVQVGANSWIGANATVRSRIRIGENSIIGAGAVVVSDIPSDVVAVGVPARVIRQNRR